MRKKSVLIMIQNIYDNLVDHFSKHDGLADVIIGPEREDWFNGEAIAAVGKKHHDWWVYGEMTYSYWAEKLKLDAALVEACGTRLPDLFCTERQTDAMMLLGEAKLVRRSTDKSPFGAGEQNLVVQLNRAYQFAELLKQRKIKSPQICGIIYGLYNPANMFPGSGEEDPECPGLSMNTEFKTASPDAFFKYIAERWKKEGKADWLLWRDAMQLPKPLQDLSPKYSNIASNLCVGIGMVLHCTDPQLNGK